MLHLRVDRAVDGDQVVVADDLVELEQVHVAGGAEERRLGGHEHVVVVPVHGRDVVALAAAPRSPAGGSPSRGSSASPSVVPLRHVDPEEAVLVREQLRTSSAVRRAPRRVDEADLHGPSVTPGHGAPASGADLVGAESARIVVMTTDEPPVRRAARVERAGRARSPSWWHRDHPTFAALTGFFTGLLFVALVPALFFGGAQPDLRQRQAPRTCSRSSWSRWSSRSGWSSASGPAGSAPTFWIGMVLTALVVVGVGALGAVVPRRAPGD